MPLNMKRLVVAALGILLIIIGVVVAAAPAEVDCIFCEGEGKNDCVLCVDARA